MRAGEALSLRRMSDIESPGAPGGPERSRGPSNRPAKAVLASRGSGPWDHTPIGLAVSQ